MKYKYRWWENKQGEVIFQEQYEGEPRVETIYNKDVYCMEIVRDFSPETIPYIIQNDSKKRGYTISIKLVKKICWCVAVITLLDGIISTYLLADMYRHTVIAYQKFEIDGVKFEYTDYRIMIGYHNAKSHGRVIRDNGQCLKIEYVHYSNENIIVYIEEFHLFGNETIKLGSSYNSIVDLLDDAIRKSNEDCDFENKN